MRIVKKDWNLSLDSLSDTMTNGVGILILILVTVTPASLLDGSKHDTADTTERRVASDAPPSSLSAEELQAGIAERKGRLARLKREVDDAERQIHDRQSQWDKIRQANKPQELRIPTLQPAPEGLRPLFFVCRNQRVYPLDMERISEKLMQGVRKATGQLTGQITVGPVEKEGICDYFDEHDIGDEYFRVRIENLGFDLLMKILPRRAYQGETVAQIRSPKSSFAKAIRAIDPSERFVQFTVWNDSFDVYAVVREIIDAAGETPSLLANWLPMKEDEEVRCLLIRGGSSKWEVQ